MSDRTDAFDRWRDWAEKPLDSDPDDPSAELGDLKGSFDGGSLSAWRRESPAPLLVLRALGRQRGLYSSARLADSAAFMASSNGRSASWTSLHISQPAS